MALNGNATAIIKVGHFYTATTNTVPPADYLAPEVAWAELGHTSIENIFALSSEGGESTVIRTLQADNLRETFSARTESFAITLQQLDQESEKLYFGSNAVFDADTSLLWVPNKPVPTEKAFLGVFRDGDYYFVIYAPKVSIKRGDDLDFGDGSNLTGLPLVITPLDVAGNDGAWAISPLLEVA